MSTRKPPTQGRSKPPSRTTTLPASLRAELVELGRLPAAGKGKSGRKERRKEKRDGGKAARAKHFASKKRPAEEVEDEEEEEEIVEKPAPKKIKTAPAPVEAPKKKTTALERLLAKQEGGNDSPVDLKRKKNNVESTEDREIAWLEAKLGVRGGPAAADKGKWNEEIMDDGLDGLSFAFLERRRC